MSETANLVERLRNTGLAVSQEAAEYIKLLDQCIELLTKMRNDWRDTAERRKDEIERLRGELADAKRSLAKALIQSYPKCVKCEGTGSVEHPSDANHYIDCHACNGRGH